MSRKLLLILLASSFSTFAADKTEIVKVEHAKTDTESTAKIPTDHQFDQAKIEFKSYITSLPATTRSEVTDYRKEIAKLNRQKRDLYKHLSQDAQKYLAKEQEFKKRYSYKVLQAIVDDLNPQSPSQTHNSKEAKSDTVKK